MLKCLIDLQNFFPHAQVVYTPSHTLQTTWDLQYMVRLGLWGPKGFCETKEALLKKVEGTSKEVLAILRWQLAQRHQIFHQELSLRGHAVTIPAMTIPENMMAL